MGRAILKTSTTLMTTMLLLTACDQGSADTTAGRSTTSTIATTTSRPATTTTIATTTTTSRPSEPDSLAQVKAQAALDALPAGWAGEINRTLGLEVPDDDDLVFSTCLGPGDYDLDALDADSAGAWEMDATGPSTDGLLAPIVAVEARLFSGDADGDTIYAVLEKVLGTDEGRQCIADQVAEVVADFPPDSEFEFAVEPSPVAGADVGVRVSASFGSDVLTLRFFSDIVATRVDDSCLVFATFVSFGEPFEEELAASILAAAVG